MSEAVGGGVFADAGREEVEFAFTFADPCAVQGGVSVAQRFDFGAFEDEAGFYGIAELEVV